jgi:hypothetical protein
MAPLRGTSLIFALLTLTGASAGLPAQTAEVRGVVQSTAGSVVLIGAEVTLVGANRTVRTDTAGVFVFADLAPGRYVVHVRFLGHRATVAEATIAAGETHAMTLSLEPVPVTLPPAVVVGEARVAALERYGFYERQARGVGYFITKEEIEQVNPLYVSDVLSRVPGLQVITQDGGLNYRVRTRRAKPSLMKGECYPLYYVDGQRLPLGFEINEFNPEVIAAIEVYVGAATVPSQFRRLDSDCGVILIWTGPGDV